MRTSAAVFAVDETKRQIDAMKIIQDAMNIAPARSFESLNSVVAGRFLRRRGRSSLDEIARHSLWLCSAAADPGATFFSRRSSVPRIGSITTEDTDSVPGACACRREAVCGNARRGNKARPQQAPKSKFCQNPKISIFSKNSLKINQN